MQKLRPLLAFLALAVIFVMGLALGFFAWRLAGAGSGPKFYNTATVLKQVQTLSQLVTVKYVMEKVVVVEDVKTFDVKWLFENRVLFVAHGIVKAGVDFEHLKPEDVQVTGNKISIRLPPAQITDAYLDERQTHIVERTTGVLRTFDKDLEQKARQSAVDDIRRAARTAGILKDADDRARAQLKNLFTAMGLEVEFLVR